jgi:hypothetical protein
MSGLVYRVRGGKGDFRLVFSGNGRCEAVRDNEASWMTRPSGGGLRNGVQQSRQLQIILAHAALVSAFLDICMRIDRCPYGKHSSNVVIEHGDAYR